MKIVAWNMAHQTRDQAVPEGFWPALKSWSPDIISLNEYVHGVHGPAFIERLKGAGLPFCEVSTRQSRHNQVLIASRHPMSLGDLHGPDLGDGAGLSNFLHVKFPALNFEFVGIRCPAYPGRSDLLSYWSQLEALIASTNKRRIVYAGDFNANPDRPKYAGAISMARLRDAGWCIPKPDGLWSFVGGTHIDHAIVSAGMDRPSARYVSEVDGYAVASKDRSTRISDHAALILDL